MHSENDAVSTESVTVNGTVHPLGADSSLSTLLVSMGVDIEKARGVAIAINDTVIRKRNWSTHHLLPGDRVEIVTARQGG